MKVKKDPYFDPSCCNYKLSGKTRTAIDELIKKDDIEPGTRDKLVELMNEEESNKNTLSYDSLANLHKYLQRADPETYLKPFYTFLDDCKCIKPEPRENQSLQSRLNELRLNYSKSLYDKMASSVDRTIENRMEEKSSTLGDSTAKEIRLFNGSMMAVINSFLVYVCTFIFCYKALEYALPEPYIIGQTLFGLFGSTVVACAELYFLARVI